MRLANVGGRAVVQTGEDDGLDVATASEGKFGPDLPSVYQQWTSFRAWYELLATRPLHDGAAPPGRVEFGPQELDCPAPDARQVIGVGLNYVDHAEESGLPLPDEPVVFTKFTSSLAGPRTRVVLPAGDVDWEAELVVVIGSEGRHVAESEAWQVVAGFCVGQDLSERRRQLRGNIPQFSLGKSHAGFGPVGPCLVTVDELGDANDLELGCLLNGEVVQRSRTSQMVFTVPALIARLSAVVDLLPGDVIFTGTPAGVGAAHRPPRFLAPGDELTTYIEGIGEIRQTFVDGADAAPRTQEQTERTRS